MKKETLEALFKKGYITEDTFKKGIQKFSDGGLVQQDPTTTTPANPQVSEAPIAPLERFAPSVQEEIKSRQQFRAAQSPSPLVEEESTIASDIAKQAMEGIAPPPMKKAQEPVSEGIDQVSDMMLIPQEKPEEKPSPFAGIAEEYDKAFAQMQSGIMQEAEAGARSAAAQASAYNSAISQLQKGMQERKVIEQQRSNQLQDQALKMESAIDDFKKASVVDPNRFWSDKSTGDKIMASVAIFLGGLGGGPNQALQVIDNAIQRDIESQKQNAIAKKGAVDLQNNIWQNMMDQFNDETAAFTASRLAALNIAEMQIKKAEAGTASQRAKANAQMALGQLGLKKTELQQQLLNQVRNSPQMLQSDAETKAILSLPENFQKEAFKEKGRLQAISSQMNQLDKIYGNLIKATTLKERVKSPIQTSSFIEKAEADLFPIIKEIVGERMSDADAKILIKSQLPKLTDNEETVNRKLRDLQDALKAVIPGELPILTGFGIYKQQKPMTFKRNE